MEYPKALPFILRRLERDHSNWRSQYQRCGLDCQGWGEGEREQARQKRPESLQI